MKAIVRYFPVVMFINMLYKVVQTFLVWGWNPKVWPLKWKLLHVVVLTFESVGEILTRDHSIESY